MHGMATYSPRMTRCSRCLNRATCYRFSGVVTAKDRMPLCQSCARHYFGDDYIDRMIAHGILRWKRTKQPDTQQSLLGGNWA